MLRTNTTAWARLLAYVTGLVNQELMLQNEYLAAENRILKARLQPGSRLSDGERATLAEIGKRLGRQGLQPVARIAQTRYHTRLVSPTGGRKIRRLQAAPIARAAAHQSRDRGSGGSLGSRELRLGL